MSSHSTKKRQGSSSRCTSAPAYLIQANRVRTSLEEKDVGYARQESAGSAKRIDRRALKNSPPAASMSPQAVEVRPSGDRSVRRSGGYASKSTTANISSPEPESTDCSSALNQEEFVEGGIELLPPKRPPSADRQVRGHGETTPLHTLKAADLCEIWPRTGGSKAVFLDYDGTLREFEARPELATPTEEIMRLLSTINGRADIIPHIISGRDAKFLKEHFADLNRFTLICEHGYQIWRVGGSGWELSDHNLTHNHADWKMPMRKEINKCVAQIPGSHLEEKDSSLVWHYREVSESIGDQTADHIAAKLDQLRVQEKIDDVRVSHGHKVVEVSYRRVTKGLVMRQICEHKAAFGEPFTAVLAAGDDCSDESMFEFAPQDFVTIKVGHQPTHARFRVNDPEQLRRFLWWTVGSADTVI
eukprot:gnl/TRDRNA2_/TRDRNA2_168724_c0_seq5.p1 gnl/TRDRNA2_/TRDRNA2_168724_c0~~gnl/TRDRNA2_/TRDRNA2_168724_c0_seq5.p1  ORF type:complete len:416 (+),score=59.26 gnl/TRDRNA2_/TRDRNA2_168724_c0_seq5:96-1343(+)